MGEEFNKACNRIRSIDFNKIKYRKRNSDFILLCEFIRRINELNKKYFVNGAFHPFYGMNRMEEIFKTEVDIDVLDGFEYIKEMGGRDRLEFVCADYLSSIRLICIQYLKYSYIIDKGNVIADIDKNLYEPLMKIYERGGGFTIGGKCLKPYDINTGLMLRIKPLDISDEALDEYDKLLETEVKKLLVNINN